MHMPKSAGAGGSLAAHLRLPSRPTTPVWCGGVGGMCGWNRLLNQGLDAKVQKKSDYIFTGQTTPRPIETLPSDLITKHQVVLGKSLTNGFVTRCHGARRKFTLVE